MTNTGHPFELGGPLAADTSPVFLRVLPHTTSNMSPTPTQPGQKFALDIDSVYQIVSGVRAAGAMANDEDFNRTRILKRQSSSNMEGVFVLQYAHEHDEHGQDYQDDNGDSYAKRAFLYGPFLRLVDIGRLVPSASIPVNVLLSPWPIPSEFADISTRGHARRGNFGVTEAVRFIPGVSFLHSQISPQEWEELLTPLSNLVDRFTQETNYWAGNTIELLTREVYNPETDSQLYNNSLVFVTARPKSIESALQCIYEIGHLLCTRGYHKIQVELVHSTVTRAEGLKNSAQDRTSMSAPISRPGIIGGVIGGYIHLSKSQDLYAMTPHHVVSKDPGEIKFESTGHLKHVIECPPKSAVVKSIKSVKKGIRERKKYLQKNPTDSVYRTSLEMRRKTLSELLPLMGLKVFGYTAVSSGLTNLAGSTNFDMDWALIKVADVARVKLPYNSIEADLTDMEFDITNQVLKNGQLKFGSLKEYTDDYEYDSEDEEDQGPLVAKFNASQQATYGHLSPYRVHTKMAGSGLSYSVFEAAESKAFGNPGDSGCWVMGTKGNVVGLFFGGDFDKKSNRTFIVDMEDVLKDIERATGQKPTIA